jgi:uncharacterized protein YjbI with pentapeptide repeats
MSRLGIVSQLWTAFFNAQTQRLVSHDREAWHAYWQGKKQPWRTEPEIDKKRQEYLMRRRGILPDIKQGIYPFKDIKLSRADVEWLLATHENGRGPVGWNDASYYERQGLDLRGANLSGADLSYLPLTKMLGGLTGGAWTNITPKHREMAAVHMEHAYLKGTHLEGATLGRAHLEGCYLGQAHLEQVYLRAAHLEGADLGRAHLEASDLSRSHLNFAYLREAHLEGAILTEAHLEGASLRETYLGGKLIQGSSESYLTKLTPANLRGAFFDVATNLEGVRLGDRRIGFTLLADIYWGNANLAVVDWKQVSMPGDEFEARQKMRDAKLKSRTIHFEEFERAVRANRQLAIALQAQGLNEQATHFAYRAQALQKSVLWYQILRHGVKLRERVQVLGAFLLSWFLFLLAGYGYKPQRSFLAYLLVIGAFAGIYFALGAAGGAYHLEWYEAIVVSMTAFHGRGFFANQFKPGDPQAFVAAFEALVGLIIEVTFIATLTRRLFGQ